MASAQCYKTCQETCQQKTQSLTCQQKTHQSSFGHKISDMFKGHHNGATNTQQNCHGGSNHHIVGATQTHANKSQCHSQCRGDNHHSSCSYFRTHTTHTTQGYGAANHLHNGCSKSHTHTQSCGGANHHKNGGGYGMTTKSSETEYFHSETKTTTGKKEHKSGGMLQKIKNKVSGHSDSSSSDSESDSDNESKCRRRSRKNCN